MASTNHPLPVHIGPQVLWGVIVDHQLHTVHINASSGSICADEADETQAVGLRPKQTSTPAYPATVSPKSLLEISFPETRGAQ